MSDTSNTDEVPDESGADVPETDWKAEAERLKAEARKWESRSKDNAKAAQRLAEFEESQKSELQKLQERAERAEAVAAKFETAQQVTAWKTEVEAATGVPARLLRGSSREELQAHAEELKPEISSAARQAAIVPGAGNIPENSPNDEAAFARAFFGRN